MICLEFHFCPQLLTSFLESHVVATCDEIIIKTCMFGSECDVYVAKHKAGYNDYLL